MKGILYKTKHNSTILIIDAYKATKNNETKRGYYVKFITVNIDENNKLSSEPIYNIDTKPFEINFLYDEINDPNKDIVGFIPGIVKMKFKEIIKKRMDTTFNEFLEKQEIIQVHSLKAAFIKLYHNEIDAMFNYFNELIGNVIGVTDSVIIAGGAPAQFLKYGHIIGDIDLWFTDVNSFHAVGKILDKLSENVTTKAPDTKYHILLNDADIPVELDVILNIFDSPKEILDLFDINCAKIAIDPNTRQIYTTDDAITSIMTNNISITENIKPNNIFYRLLKYNKYGFEICKQTQYDIFRIFGEDLSVIKKLKGNIDEFMKDSYLT